MDPDRYRRATEIFLAASERTGSARDELVDAACAGDPELARIVAELLAADGRAAGFLEASPARALRAASDALPERVGPFHVVGVLGRGAMGTVYEAEQEHPHRRVAVKVLQPGLLSRSLLARFRYEAELLGRLQHPGIAQVHASGTEDTPAGPRPWIAMELVQGVRVDRHVRDRALGVAETLELVARIADAVHHAHQRGVVHRDLKAANVLVDSSGAPRVLDFGLARAEEADVRESLATEPGLLIGTLATMSPEQATAAGDVDVRTDVYSLGAIAYELLAGRPPLELVGLPLPQALVAIAEREPPPLGSLARRLRGDVEIVVAKALEKDRELRYSSAAAFADDLRRIVRGEPVEARAPGTLYIVSKLVRRHRAVAASLAIALVGLVALAAQSWSAARAERDKRRELETAAAIDRFVMRDLLESPDPRKQGRDVRVVDVLERAAGRVDEAFSDQPHVQATVRLSLGKSFQALGEHERALEQTRTALDWLRAHDGARDERALEAAGVLVESLTALTRREEGIPLARETLDAQREVLGADHASTLTTATNLASMLIAEGAWTESEELYRDVIARRERTIGADHRATLRARENLSVVEAATGRTEESLATRRDCVRLRVARYGERDPDSLIARVFLAQVELAMGKLERPVETLEALVGEMREVWGPRHDLTADAMRALAAALERTGRVEDAAVLHQEVLDLVSETLGPKSDRGLDAKLSVAQALLRLEQRERAAELAAEVVAAHDERGGAPMRLGVALVVLGGAQLHSGRRAQGVEALERAVRTLEPIGTAASGFYLGRARGLLAEP